MSEYLSIFLYVLGGFILGYSACDWHWISAALGKHALTKGQKKFRVEEIKDL